MLRNCIDLSLPLSWKIRNISSPSASIKSFLWWERAILISDFHDHMISSEGKARGFRYSSGWSLKYTACALKISKQMVLNYCHLKKVLDCYPSLKDISSIRKAIAFCKNNGYWNGYGPRDK
jgi:hypothetical protein